MALILFITTDNALSMLKKYTSIFNFAVKILVVANHKENPYPIKSNGRILELVDIRLLIISSGKNS